MAVKIRLHRMGARKAPFYRIMIVDSRFPCGDRFIKEIGYYNPMEEPSVVKVNVEKAKKWISNGAQPTDTVRGPFKKYGVIQKVGGNLPMERSLVTIAQGLVEHPEAVTVQVDEPSEDDNVVYHLHVVEDDIGRMIGKQGRVAKAIRVVMRAATTRTNDKVPVEID